MYKFLVEKYKFSIFAYEFFKVILKKCKLYQKYIIFGSKYFLILPSDNRGSCSCKCFFPNVHPACHSIVNGIKPGSNSKKTDKHAADCSKAVCWGVKKSMYDV